MHTSKSVSIIIPAYNEEHHLGACLDAIAAQTDRPDEVIVVDNNSTDHTAAVARRYPFVTLIHERQPGLIVARNAGFARAHGDILGRINADALLETDWVARVRQAFTANPHLGGMSGPGISDTLPFTHAYATTIWSQGYFLWTDAFLRVRTLWGANMVISRRAWDDIRPRAAIDDKLVHEDQDLSILLAGRGWQVRRDNRLLIRTYGHDYHEWPKFTEYVRRRWRTWDYHQAAGTLKNPEALRLPLIVSLLVRFVAILPIGFFGATSLTFYAGHCLTESLRQMAGRLQAAVR